LNEVSVKGLKLAMSMNVSYRRTPLTRKLVIHIIISGVPRIFFGEGGRGEIQQIQLRTEDRENGDLGAVAI
jgi:hypothetical protein